MPFARLADLRSLSILLGWTPDYSISTFVNLYLGVPFLPSLALPITAASVNDYNGDLVDD